MTKPALQDCRHAESDHRSKSQSHHSGVGRISLFGQDVSAVVVLAILTLPFVGTLLGGATGDITASAAIEFVAEFGALVSAVASTLHPLLRQAGTFTPLVMMSVAVVVERVVTVVVE